MGHFGPRALGAMTAAPFFASVSVQPRSCALPSAADDPKGPLLTKVVHLKPHLESASWRSSSRAAAATGLDVLRPRPSGRSGDRPPRATPRQRLHFSQRPHAGGATPLPAQCRVRHKALFLERDHFAPCSVCLPVIVPGWGRDLARRSRCPSRGRAWGSAPGSSGLPGRRPYGGDTLGKLLQIFFAFFIKQMWRKQ